MVTSIFSRLKDLSVVFNSKPTNQVIRYKHEGQVSAKIMLEQEAAFLKCHCNKKIFDPILDKTEQHFHASHNGVFSFDILARFREIQFFCNMQIRCF